MLIASAAPAVADMATPDTLWRSWSAEPAVVASLLGIAALYARAAWVARRQSHGRAVTGRMVLSFAAGWSMLAVALVSPLDRLGEALFAGHMAQHLVMIVVAAPLCVLGAPPGIWLWALPRAPRRSAARWWVRARVTRRVTGLVARPPVALVLHTAALWFWHFPRPYQAALANPFVHVAEHASFFGTALLFWWVVLQPVGRRALGYGPAILYVAFTLCQSGALGALLMFSTHAWYPAHAAGERLWGLAPLEDQQAAGLIMWIPAGAVYIAAAAALFLQWMAADQRLTRRRESGPALFVGEAA